MMLTLYFALHWHWLFLALRSGQPLSCTSRSSPSGRTWSVTQRVCSIHRCGSDFALSSRDLVANLVTLFTMEMMASLLAGSAYHKLVVVRDIDEDVRLLIVFPNTCCDSHCPRVRLDEARTAQTQRDD